MEDNKFEAVARTICNKLNAVFICYIAKGAFKETYKISIADQYFALKIFDHQKSHPERNEREIHALKACKSTLIANFIDSGIEVYNGNKFTFSVEEYLDGGTLTQRLKKSGVFDENTIITLTLHFVDALEHLRALRLVHRDIKADNIMFRGDTDIPVLVDFGLVRNLSEASLTATWLAQGPGTPLFSPPEQLNNEKLMIDWRSDQFSIGLLLGYCYTGTHPYYTNARTMGDIIVAMSNKESCSQEFLEKIIGTKLAYIAKMIEPWPIKRFQTPGQIKEMVINGGNK